MTDDKLRAALPFPTTDAMKWVRAFRETFPAVNVDDGTMLGWFANAIEHGRGPDGLAASATDDPTQPCDCDTIPRRLRDRRSRADGHAYDCPPHYRREHIPPRPAASATDERSHPPSKAQRESWMNSGQFASATDEERCGCTMDAAEPGPCPYCHHREHGSTGCHAASACPHRCGNPACSNPDHWTMTNLGTKETKPYDR